MGRNQQHRIQPYCLYRSIQQNHTYTVQLNAGWGNLSITTSVDCNFFIKSFQNLFFHTFQSNCRKHRFPIQGHIHPNPAGTATAITYRSYSEGDAYLVPGKIFRPDDHKHEIVQSVFHLPPKIAIKINFSEI